MIHRDLKPSNCLIVFLDKDKSKPRLKVCDFGLARFVPSDGSTYLTVIGTRNYMATEFLRALIESSNDGVLHVNTLTSLNLKILEEICSELFYL